MTLLTSTECIEGADNQQAPNDNDEKKVGPTITFLTVIPCTEGDLKQQAFPFQLIS